MEQVSSAGSPVSETAARRRLAEYLRAFNSGDPAFPAFVAAHPDLLPPRWYAAWTSLFYGPTRGLDPPADLAAGYDSPPKE